MSTQKTSTSAQYFMFGEDTQSLLPHQYVVLSLTAENYPIPSEAMYYAVHAGIVAGGEVGLRSAKNTLTKLRALDRPQSNTIVYTGAPLVFTQDPKHLHNAQYQEEVRHKVLTDLVNFQLQEEEKLDGVGQGKAFVPPNNESKNNNNTTPNESKKNNSTTQQMPSAVQSSTTTTTTTTLPAECCKTAQGKWQNEENEEQIWTAEELFATPSGFRPESQKFAVVQTVQRLGDESTLPEPLLIVHGIVSDKEQHNRLTRRIDRYVQQHLCDIEASKVRLRTIYANRLLAYNALELVHDGEMRESLYLWALHKQLYLMVPLDEAKSPYYNRFTDIDEVSYLPADGESAALDDGNNAAL
jgi:hypothetical protein